MARYTPDEIERIEAARSELNPFANGMTSGDGHAALVHERCDRDICSICDGGLFICTRCSSFEGATTTHCPGRRIHLTDEVYAGRLDYRVVDGVGQWVAGPSVWTPALWRLACERAGVAA